MKTMEVRVDDNAASTAALDPLLLESGGGAGGGGGGTVTLGKLTVEVTSLSVSWVASGGGRHERVVSFADLLGCTVPEDGPCRVLLHTCPRRAAGCCGTSIARHVVCHALACEMPEQARSLAATIRKFVRAHDLSVAVDASSGARRRMLVLINPYGGAGKALKVWGRLERLLAPCEIEFDVTTTTHAGHAREIGATLAPELYEAIVTVSGDGLFNELVNGLMERTSHGGGHAQTSAQISLPALFAAPGGTGNGLFKSLCARAGEADDLLAAAMLIAKGRPTPIDLWQYVRPGISSHPATPPAAEGSAGGGGSEGGDEGGGSHIAPASPSSSLPMWSFLSFAWGIIGDIDIESEVIRCCRLATLALAITLT